MNRLGKLRKEAKAIIAAFDPAGDFEETLLALAAVGYGVERALKGI